MIVPTLLALLALPHVATARLDRAPQLDGRTDDPAWAGVPATPALVRYLLGSTLFLVYSRSQHSDTGTTQAALAKLIYWWGR